MGPAVDRGDAVTFASCLTKVKSSLFKLEEVIFRKEMRRLKAQSWLFSDGKALAASIDRSRKKSMRSVGICGLAGLALTMLGALLSFCSPSLEQQLMRPDFGEAPGAVIVEVQAEYQGHTVDETLRLRLAPKLLTSEEETERIRICARRLHDLMLGANDSLLGVRGDLALPRIHDETGVLLSWESSDPARVDPEGSVNLIGLTPGETVTLTAELSLGKTTAHREYVIAFAPVQPEDYAQSLQRYLEGLQESLSAPASADKLVLPGRGSHNILLQWTFPKSSGWLIPIPLGALIAAAIYLSHMDTLQKELKQRRKAVEAELPNFSLQLTLLLNAGLVVTAAFDEILRSSKDGSQPLYEILRSLQSRCSQTNESFVKALYRFAQTTGSRDFLRLSTLIADHASRGSALADKLERERTHLWEGRLQKAQARAKEVETKLCLPLMLLLCVLVVIAAAPALMEM